MRRPIISVLATLIVFNLPACDPSELDERDLVIVGESDGGESSSGGEDTGVATDTLGLEFPEPEVCEPGIGVEQQAAYRELETLGRWRAELDPHESGPPTPGQIARGALCQAACFSAYAKCGSPTYNLTTYSTCMKQCDVLAKLSCNALWAACGKMPTKPAKESCYLFYNVACSGQ